jgi:ribosomal protein S14
MATITAPTQADLDMAKIVSKYQGMKVTDLRKAAQGKISNVKGMRKAELIDAMVDFDLKAAKFDQAAKIDDEERVAREAADDKKAGRWNGEKVTGEDVLNGIVGADVTTKIEKTPRPAKDLAPKKAKTYKSTAKPKIDATPLHEAAKKATAEKAVRTDDGKVKGNRCAVCGNRPIDRKTQGRDSTMCRPCFDFAGWENTHTDEGHDGLADGSTKFDDPAEEKAVRKTMTECPVCAGTDPANTPPKKNGSKPGRKVTKRANVQIDGLSHPKAAQFYHAAKSAGWSAEVISHEAGTTGRASFTVIAKTEGREISLSWVGGAYDYDSSAHTDAKGVRKVRNASAAIKAIESV